MSTQPLAVVHPDNLAALGVCRALGPRGVDCAVLASDHTAPGQYSRYARRVQCPPATDERAWVDFLVAFGKAQRQRPVLFLTDDSSLVAAHRHRAELEPWYRFPFGPWSVLEPMMLKDELYRTLEGIVAVPRTATPASEAEVGEAVEAVGLPAILKPVLRCLQDAAGADAEPFEKVFGAKAVRIRTRDEALATWRRAREHGFTLVVQEEIPGPITNLVSVGLCATRAGVAAAFTSRKLGQVPAEFGDGLIVQAAPVPEIVPLAGRAVERFGYHGLADIEFKRDARSGEYKLLDINPRPWLWINLPTACGVNLPWAAYLDATGRRVDPLEFVQRDFETRWVSMRGVAIAAVRGVLAGCPQEVVRLLARHVRRPRVGPLAYPGDALVRMFLSPRFWRESLRSSAASVARLKAARHAVPAAADATGESR